MKQDTCANVGKYALGYVVPAKLHFHFKSALIVTSKSYIQASQSQINQSFSKVAGAFLHRNHVFPDSDHKP